jgi:Lrp/AsnC family transcriptional regulator for asnA, asnC and gidA
VSGGPLPDRPLPPASIDATDHRIIELLQLDGRAPYETVAATVGVSTEDVRERVEAMLDAGVIDIVAVTDPLQLGYARQAMLGIIASGPVQPIGAAMASIEEVIYQARTTGGFDLLAEVVGTSDAHLLELVTRIRRLPGVSRIHTFLYQELVKETYAYGVGVAPGDRS